MTRKNSDVLIPHGYKPAKKEIEVAWILARNYDTIVKILRPSMRYKVKTPDFSINKKFAELKTPTSHQVRKIKTLFLEGSRQAKIIVLDGRKTKILDKRLEELSIEAVAQINIEMVLLIDKSKKVLEIKRKRSTIKI